MHTHALHLLVKAEDDFVVKLLAPEELSPPDTESLCMFNDQCIVSARMRAHTASKITTRSMYLYIIEA
jgi:hypothetical protein